MKNNFIAIAKNIFHHLTNHLREIFNPQTPSYKTSMTAAILFALITLFTGGKYTLFWLTLTCCIFFSALTLKQYGIGNLIKRS